MANILLYDLEITPILGWTYDMWDASVVKVEREPYIMCFSYKHYDDNHMLPVIHVQQPYFPSTYKRDPYDDKMVVEQLWGLMDNADIVVAHNAKKFDNRIANSRFIHHCMDPPSPYKTVDTLTAARRFFRFPSNSLASLGETLGLGEKPEATHAKLWRKCIDGDKDAWDKMREYNDRDVQLLENLYTKLRPFITNHPSVSVFDQPDGCPKCGSTQMQWRGYATTNISTFKRYQCQNCGGWGRVRVHDSEIEKPIFTGA